MIMFREELKELEGFAAQQQLVYPDASDIGIRIDRWENEHARERIREIVKSLREIRESVRTWGRGKICGKSWQFFIPIEMDEGMYAGTQITIGWHRDRKQEFLTIDLERAMREKLEFQPVVIKEEVGKLDSILPDRL